MESELFLFSEDMEPVVISWANRIPQRPFSLVIINGGHGVKRESMRVIEKFQKLGVVVIGNNIRNGSCGDKDNKIFAI